MQAKTERLLGMTINRKYFDEKKLALGHSVRTTNNDSGEILEYRATSMREDGDSVVVECEFVGRVHKAAVICPDRSSFDAIADVGLDVARTNVYKAFPKCLRLGNAAAREALKTLFDSAAIVAQSADTDEADGLVGVPALIRNVWWRMGEIENRRMDR